MKRIFLGAAIAAALLTVACAPKPPAGGGSTTSTSSTTTTIPGPTWLTPTFYDQMLARFNTLRAGVGLGPVTRCAALDLIAQHVVETDPFTNGYTVNFSQEYAAYGGPPLGPAGLGQGYFSSTAINPVAATNALYAGSVPNGATPFNRPDIVHIGFGATAHQSGLMPNQVFAAVGTGGTC